MQKKNKNETRTKEESLTQSENRIMRDLRNLARDKSLPKNLKVKVSPLTHKMRDSCWLSFPTNENLDITICNLINDNGFQIWGMMKTANGDFLLGVERRKTA